MRQSRLVRIISIVLLICIIWLFGGIYDIALAVNKEIQSQSVGNRKDDLESRLANALNNLDYVSKALSYDLRVRKKTIQQNRLEIETIDKSIRQKFNDTEKHLKQVGMFDEICQRYYIFVAHYEKNLKKLLATLQEMENISTDAEFNAEAEKLRQHLDVIKPPTKHKPLDPKKLPHRALDSIKRKPRMKPEEFKTEGIAKIKNLFHKPILFASNDSTAGLMSRSRNLPTTEELAETIDVQFTPLIKAKAEELEHNPIKIYNWVRNNIDFVPTYGSIQGADMTLQSRKGNAFDTASLLIALLRISNVPARYVYGTIEVPIEKAMKWAGGFTDPMAALDFFGTGGIPVNGLSSGGKIVMAQMEHVWVEAYVDYIPSRGARHRQGDTWIPIDASFKEYIFTEGLDIKSAISFDVETFIDQIRSGATINEIEGYATNVNTDFIQQEIEKYKTQVESYLLEHYPDANREDVLGRKGIMRQELPYLLETLPYRIQVRGAQYATLPDKLRYKISFDVSGSSGCEAGFHFTTSLVELSGKRITLSYAPATEQDTNLILSYGDAQSLPAYLIRLKPALKIDGNSKAAGATITLGEEQNFTMTFRAPDGRVESISNQVIAGEYYSIILNNIGIPFSLLQANIDNLKNAQSLYASQQYSRITLDEVIGEGLHAIGLMYFYELDAFNAINATAGKLFTSRFPSEAIVFHGIDVSYLFSVPHIAKPGRLHIDVDRDVQIVFSGDGNASKAKNYMLLAGMTGSALEHGIFEQLYQSDGISAVKALNIANNMGIPVYVVTDENIDRVLPLLQVSDEVKLDIVNNVNAGNIVTISKTNINYREWVGVGYITQNPITGESGYMISGGLAGGTLITYIFSLLSSFLIPPAETSDKISIEMQSFLMIAEKVEVAKEATDSEECEVAIILITFTYLLRGIFLIYQMQEDCTVSFGIAVPMSEGGLIVMPILGQIKGELPQI